MPIANSRRKLMIAVFMLCIAVVGFIAMTFSIIAATTQQVQSVFSVTYNADNVQASVTGTYSINSGTANALSASDGSNAISFAPGDSDSSKTLSCSSAGLTPSDNNVFFVYKFENNNPAGGRSMKVDFTDNSVYSNMTVTYSCSTTSEPTASQTASSTTGKNIQLIISGNSTGYIAIYIKITSIYADASYVSTATSGVNATISSVT